jgi:hypothetical protein
LLVSGQCIKATKARAHSGASSPPHMRAWARAGSLLSKTRALLLRAPPLLSRRSFFSAGPQRHITSENRNAGGTQSSFHQECWVGGKYCASVGTCARRAATVSHVVWTSPTHPTPCHQRSKPGSSRVQDGLLYIHISPTCRPQKKVEVQSKASASTAAHRSTCYRSSKHSCLCPVATSLHPPCPRERSSMSG